ncbi:hypothetical protein D9M73_50890 [compost metagenome]
MKIAMLASVCALSLLAGCATKVVSSSPRQVIISGPDGATVEAQKLAEAECSKHQRFARLIARPSYNSDQFVFDCVS